MREAAGLHRLAVLARVTEGRFILAGAKPEQFFGLSQPVNAQLVHYEHGKSDSARAARLRPLVANPLFGLLGTFHYGQLGICDVDLPPRRAMISPRLSPQRTPRMTGTRRRVPRTASSSSTVCAMSYVLIVARSTFGGLTASAGLREMISQRTT